MVTYTQGVMIDHTDGTGVFPASTVVLPANSGRRWFYVQNRDTTAVTVTYTAQKAVDGVATTVTISLVPAIAAGGAGGSEERSAVFIPVLGEITITGTTGKQVVIVDAI